MFLKSFELVSTHLECKAAKSALLDLQSSPDSLSAGLCQEFSSFSSPCMLLLIPIVTIHQDHILLED